MAGSVTTTGVQEWKRETERFPVALEARLRALAKAAAHRVQAGARQRLLAQTRGTGATAAEIVVEEDAAAKAFRVISKAPQGKAANLPIWIEHGTSKMSARPYMTPSLVVERGNYESAFRAAVEDAVRSHG